MTWACSGIAVRTDNLEGQPEPERLLGLFPGSVVPEEEAQCSAQKLIRATTRKLPGQKKEKTTWPCAQQ